MPATRAEAAAYDCSAIGVRSTCTVRNLDGQTLGEPSALRVDMNDTSYDLSDQRAVSGQK